MCVNLSANDYNNYAISVFTFYRMIGSALIIIRTATSPVIPHATTTARMRVVKGRTRIHAILFPHEGSQRLLSRDVDPCHDNKLREEIIMSLAAC